MTPRQAWLERQALCGLFAGKLDRLIELAAWAWSAATVNTGRQHWPDAWDAPMHELRDILGGDDMIAKLYIKVVDGVPAASEVTQTLEAAKNELTKERVAELMAEGAPLRQSVEARVDGGRIPPDAPREPASSPDPVEVEAMAKELLANYLASKNRPPTPIEWATYQFQDELRTHARFVLRQREERERTLRESLEDAARIRDNALKKNFEDKETIARLEKELAEANADAESARADLSWNADVAPSKPSASAIPAAELDELEAAYKNELAAQFFALRPGAVPMLIAEVRRLGEELVTAHGRSDSLGQSAEAATRRANWNMREADARGLRIVSLESELSALKSAHDTVRNAALEEADWSFIAREAIAAFEGNDDAPHWDAELVGAAIKKGVLSRLKSAHPEPAKEVDYTRACSCGDPKCGFDQEPKASEPPKEPAPISEADVEREMMRQSGIEDRYGTLRVGKLAVARDKLESEARHTYWLKTVTSELQASTALVDDLRAKLEESKSMVRIATENCLKSDNDLSAARKQVRALEANNVAMADALRAPPTTEMVEAGVKALSPFIFVGGGPEIAKAVYTAMLAARDDGDILENGP